MYFVILTLCHTDTMLFSKDVRDQYDISKCIWNDARVQNMSLMHWK